MESAVLYPTSIRQMYQRKQCFKNFSISVACRLHSDTRLNEHTTFLELRSHFILRSTKWLPEYIYQSLKLAVRVV
jgi:hypothetical protein